MNVSRVKRPGHPERRVSTINDSEKRHLETVWRTSEDPRNPLSGHVPGPAPLASLGSSSAGELRCSSRAFGEAREFTGIALPLGKEPWGESGEVVQMAESSMGTFGLLSRAEATLDLYDRLGASTLSERLKGITIQW